MVTVRDITLTSTCEHHFVTIDGKATVAYIPKDSVIGLSKINRIVQFFSQRPQVQERLTQQIWWRCRLCSAPITWRYRSMRSIIVSRRAASATRPAPPPPPRWGLFKSSQNTRRVPARGASSPG